MSDGLPDLITKRIPLLSWAGAALAEAQRLELAISTYVTLFDPRFDITTSEADISRRFDRLRRDPLGALLKALKTVGATPDDLGVDVKAIKAARNDLAHHVFAKPSYVAMAQTPEGRTQLIETFAAWASMFGTAAERVLLAALQRGGHFGVDVDTLTQHARKLGAGETALQSPAKYLAGLEKALTPDIIASIAARFPSGP